MLIFSSSFVAEEINMVNSKLTRFHRFSAALVPICAQRSDVIVGADPAPTPCRTSSNKTETSMDAKAVRRQSGAMLPDSKTTTIRTLDRINVRLPAETFEAIDAARVVRPGNISRNTWITEAVEEKLARDCGRRGEDRGAAYHA
jgi:hypothetical protein